MSDEPDLLTLWRTMSSGELRRRPELTDRLARTLSGRPGGDTGEHPGLRRPDPHEHAMFALLARARAAAAEQGGFSDEAMSWALLAALRGSRVGRLVLVQGLIRLASRGATEGQDALPGPGAEQPLESPASPLVRLALGWQVEIDAPILEDAERWIQEFGLLRPDRASRTDGPSLLDDSASSLIEPARPALPPRADPPPRVEGLSLQVVKAIGDEHSWEGQGIARLYWPITAPLALKGRVDPDGMRRSLLAEFPHLGDAIGRVVADLRLRRLGDHVHSWFRPLLLVGPSGIGKTRFAKRLAGLMGVGYGEVGAAGSSEDRALRGTARGWRNVQPCLPILTMLRSGCANPLILVDEIDKAGGSENGGDIRQTLLGLLEPETARAWFDEALLAEADLSQVSWILTANELDRISRPLRSRVGIVHCAAPGPEAFGLIFESVLGDIARSLGIDRGQLPAIEPDAVGLIRAGFGTDRDIRRMRRAIEAAIGAAGTPDRSRH